MGNNAPLNIHYSVVQSHLRRPDPRGGLMVSALAPKSSSPGSSAGLRHCVVFLGKALYFHSASLYPGVSMGTGEFNAGGNPAMD